MDECGYCVRVLGKLKIYLPFCPKNKGGLKMPIKIDQDSCIGCGVCQSLCPDVFEVGADMKAHVKEGADESLSCVDEAISSCPTGSISKE